MTQCVCFDVSENMLLQSSGFISRPVTSHGLVTNEAPNLGTEGVMMCCLIRAVGPLKGRRCGGGIA
jgi:hypothetical protein